MNACIQAFNIRLDEDCALACYHATVTRIARCFYGQLARFMNIRLRAAFRRRELSKEKSGKTGLFRIDFHQCRYGMVIS